MTIPYIIIADESGRKLVPIPVESDSDLGTMTGDTDTEADRLEYLRSEGITMENIREDAAESEDEVTQVEGSKVKQIIFLKKIQSLMSLLVRCL